MIKKIVSGILFAAIVGSAIGASAATKKRAGRKQSQYRDMVVKGDLNKNAKLASLEGELYLRADGEDLDLGQFPLASQSSKDKFLGSLDRLGFTLVNEGVVESGNSKLAIVKDSADTNSTPTYFLYFTNLLGVEFGILEINEINTGSIVLKAESASGEKSLIDLKKRAGSFLPF